MFGHQKKLRMKGYVFCDCTSGEDVGSTGVNPTKFFFVYDARLQLHWLGGMISFLYYLHPQLVPTGTEGAYNLLFGCTGCLGYSKYVLSWDRPLWEIPI